MSTPSTPPPLPTQQSKTDEYYSKGWKSYTDGEFESDANKKLDCFRHAQAYLSMSYQAAGNDTEAKKGIAGLCAFNLVRLNDYKNAEDWAKREFEINPTNVWARLAWYHIVLNKLIGHKGFVLPSDGSDFGIVANILTGGINIGRIKGKENAVKNAGIEAAKAIENKTKTEENPNAYLWMIWGFSLLDIIDNMWANNFKDKYVCEVLLNLPWKRCKEEEIKDIKEMIEEIEVQAYGYLGRMK